MSSNYAKAQLALHGVVHSIDNIGTPMVVTRYRTEIKETRIIYVAK